tara:strand:+ start:4574 stop:4840 length:267 start_codon:yes stop_codon:yes gene_type:complete
MGVFNEGENERYEILKTLVALHHSSTFLDNGANSIELFNHGASSKGLGYIVDEGYATVETRKINDIDTDFYRANERGKKCLRDILEFF